MERNLGGWLAVRLGKNRILACLLRRTDGIVTRPRLLPDEQDGVQVMGSSLTRSFQTWNVSDRRQLVDREIMAGNTYTLEALLIQTAGETWAGVDKARRRYAAPPGIAIERWTVRRATAGTPGR